MAVGVCALSRKEKQGGLLPVGCMYGLDGALIYHF